MIPVLTNLAAWSQQIALLAIAGAILPRLLKIDAPVIRHVYWRVLLAICLGLPLIQPWQAVATAPSAQVITRVWSRSLGSWMPGQDGDATPSVMMDLFNALRANWPTFVIAVLLSGIALRLAWLVLGIVRLRRLRASGAAGVRSTDILADVAALVQTKADVRQVPDLGQPVTFGVWKPTVLLPESFDSLPEGVRRAALAHELWHVRRRDWAWLVIEEVVRAVFWFHPAIWWLVSQVQRSREEVVDELTIQLTNARRTYLETLLCFADQAPVFPAAPIAGRRHLLQRMLLISKEAAMSSRRIVTSAIGTILTVIGTIAYGTTAFPLVAAAPTAGFSTAPQLTQATRDRKPNEAGPETVRERELKATLDGTTASRYLELANLQESRRARKEAEATLLAARSAFPDDRAVVAALAAFYGGQQVEQMLFVPRGDGRRMPPPPPPAPLPGDQAGIRVGGDIKPPAKIKDVKPVYPPIARQAGVEGVVIMEITLDPLGHVATARYSKSVPLLDQAALEAVSKWEYQPLLLNGVAVPVTMTVTVNFSQQ